MGATISFLAFCDAGRGCARCFFQRALQDPTHPRPRVTIVDGNPYYPKVVAEFEAGAEVGSWLPQSNLSLFE
jgi:hypothetical protein